MCNLLILPSAPGGSIIVSPEKSIFRMHVLVCASVLTFARFLPLDWMCSNAHRVTHTDTHRRWALCYGYARRCRQHHPTDRSTRRPNYWIFCFLTWMKKSRLMMMLTNCIFSFVQFRQPSESRAPSVAEPDTDVKSFCSNVTPHSNGWRRNVPCDNNRILFALLTASKSHTHSHMTSWQPR